MADNAEKFTYRVTWSEEDGEYVGLCAELPSMSWLARTAEGALRGIRKAAADVLADMESQGEPIPEPLSLRRYSGRFVIRIPPEAHRRLAIESAEAGVSLNRLASDKLSQVG